MSAAVRLVHVCFPLATYVKGIPSWSTKLTLTVQAVDVNSLCLCPVLCIIWIRNACCRNVAEYSSSKQLDVLVPMLQLFHLFLKQWSDYNLKLQIIYQACNLPQIYWVSKVSIKSLKSEESLKYFFPKKYVSTFLGYM